jgi:hypothetical protein
MPRIQRALVPLVAQRPHISAVRRPLPDHGAGPVRDMPRGCGIISLRLATSLTGPGAALGQAFANAARHQADLNPSYP